MVQILTGITTYFACQSGTAHELAVSLFMGLPQIRLEISRSRIWYNCRHAIDWSYAEHKIQDSWYKYLDGAYKFIQKRDFNTSQYLHDPNSASC